MWQSAGRLEPAGFGGRIDHRGSAAVETPSTRMLTSLDAAGGAAARVDRRVSPLVLPVVCASAGMALGVYRGGRLASLRFLAENAHRAPRTVKGWYFYNKTKNYRMMYGGLKAGAKDAVGAHEFWYLAGG